MTVKELCASLTGPVLYLASSFSSQKVFAMVVVEVTSKKSPDIAMRVLG